MLHELIRHELDYAKAYMYVKEVLERGKTLSSDILKHINIEKGSFFLLLTEEADIQRIYEFHYGGLYPVGPLKEVVDKERIYEWYTDGMKDEFRNYLYTRIANLKLNSLFEDILSLPTDPNKEFQKLYQEHGLAYNDDEVYYLLTPNTVSKELVKECLWSSDSLDHSLCLLTTAPFNDVKDKKLTLEKIEEICRETKIMIIGAYDGEGYVFWESKG